MLMLVVKCAQPLRMRSSLDMLSSKTAEPAAGFHFFQLNDERTGLSPLFATTYSTSSSSLDSPSSARRSCEILRTSSLSANETVFFLDASEEDDGLLRFNEDVEGALQSADGRRGCGPGLLLSFRVLLDALLLVLPVLVRVWWLDSVDGSNRVPNWAGWS